MIVLATRVRSEANLFVQIEPGAGVERMAIAVVRFLQLVREGPSTFHVAQVRLEILAIVSHRMVLLLPRLEPLSHLRDLVGDGNMLKYFGWHVGEGNVFDLVVGGATVEGHP